MRSFFSVALIAAHAAAIKTPFQEKQASALKPVQVVDGEWNTAYSSILENHSKTVFDGIVADVYDKNGPALETCEDGKKCREDNWKKTINEVETEWTKVYTLLTEQIESAKIKTQTIVDDGWTAHVQCGLDHPCCQYPPQFIKNTRLQVQTVRTKIVKDMEYW